MRAPLLWSRPTALAAALAMATSIGLPAYAAALPETPAELSVGTNNSMYPTFAPETLRYAVHPDSTGSVTVDVTQADRVWFNGVPSASGSATLAELEPGDEVSVFVEDEGVRRAYALFVVPDYFPTLAATTTGTPQEGHVALTLQRGAPLDGSVPSRLYETIVDRAGVPVYVRHDPVLGARDLRVAPNGALTVQRRTTEQDRTGTSLVELDGQMDEVRRRSTVGLVNTDHHDGLLMPDGSYWLVAYEPSATTELKDSVIQHVSPAGEVLFEWSTAPYASESVTPTNADYAHINSIQVLDDGDVVASFRHLDSVWRIATRAHDGFQPGDIVWKLGGRDSSFSFAPGETGPCAQHTATLLPNGNVLMFDNGGHEMFNVECVNQDDPQGALVSRTSTRVVEWDLDHASGTATVARTYGTADRYAGFAGSAFKLDNGNVLISWAPDRDTVANEVSADNEPVWELRDAAPNYDHRFFSYRAHLVPARDAIDPVVATTGPAEGARFAYGAAAPAIAFSCTDRGGSTLQACDGPTGTLDTSTPGTHTWTVKATDGAGNTTTVTRTYIVDPAPAAAPDVSVRLPATTTWHGAGVVLPTGQSARTSLPRVGRSKTVRMRVVNRGTAPGRILVTAPSKRARGAVRVSYRALGRDRTKAVAGAGWRTPRLQPGEAVTIRVRIRVVRRPGVKQARLPLRASTATARDAVTVVLRRR